MKQTKRSAKTRRVLRAVLMTTGILMCSNMAEGEEPMKTNDTKASSAPAAGADVFQSLDLRRVKVAGEIGRRIALTIKGNLLKLNPDDHLKPFVTKDNRGAEPFIGTGKTLDGMVRLAAYSGDPSLIARKKSFVEALLKTQEADGYIGIMPPDIRTWRTYDLHDQAFILIALMADHQWFGEKASLAGAQKLADYIIGRWPGKPADWGQRIPGNENIALIGLDMAFLSLYQATGERRYQEFFQALTINGKKVAKWTQPIALGRDPADALA